MKCEKSSESNKNRNKRSKSYFVNSCKYSQMIHYPSSIRLFDSKQLELYRHEDVSSLISRWAKRQAVAPISRI